MRVHFEPFVHLAGLTHNAALIAWGGFYFRDPDRDGEHWTIVPDPQIDGEVDGETRDETIGASSPPYGHAEVEVADAGTGEVVARAETDDVNHVWVRGLEPDTEYRYRIVVDGEEWARGPLRDWMDADSPHGRDLQESGLSYDLRFRTFPSPDVPTPARFAVLGDYGIGILATEGQGERQRRLGAALERAVEQAGVRFVVTTGDNIYLGEEDTIAGTGKHDDDWYYSFYEPYRYTISRVPVYPGVGNHDASDSEDSDDRDQLADNFFTDLRFVEDADEVDRVSVEPGLFYRFGYGADLEFIAVDTTKASELEQAYYLDHPKHRAFLEEALPPEDERPEHPRWRIPFSHHPPYCAGPKHHNSDHLIEAVVPLLERSGARVMLSGHEHNFQHSRVNGIDYIVTGAAGKLREGEPDGFEEAHTLAWADVGHFLIVDVDGDEMVIHPVTDVDEDGRFTYIDARSPDGEHVEMPIRVQR